MLNSCSKYLPNSNKKCNFAPQKRKQRITNKLNHNQK